MKENQRVSVTKRMLKEGLLRLLEHKPLERVRVNELCAESGINRATFYRHYQTPRDVLMEVGMDLVKQVTAVSGPPKNQGEARACLERACVCLYEHRDVARILFRCSRELDMAEQFNEFFRRFWDLRKYEKQFARLDEDTARVVMAMLAGGCYFLLRQWMLEDIQKTPQEIAAIMSNLIRWPDVPDFTAGEGISPRT